MTQQELKMKATDINTPISVKLLTAGTAACVADFASFPLDTAKVRLQVSANHFTDVPTLVKEGNIRMDLKQIGIKTRDWGHLAQDKDY